jgi:hypothetical protein
MRKGAAAGDINATAYLSSQYLSLHLYNKVPFSPP